MSVSYEIGGIEMARLYDSGLIGVNASQLQVEIWAAPLTALAESYQPGYEFSPELGISLEDVTITTPAGILQYQAITMAWGDTIIAALIYPESD